MSDQRRLVYGYQPPIAGPLRSMVQRPVTPVQQHDIPRPQFHTITELVWVRIRRKQGKGSLCRHGEPSDTWQDILDVDEPNVRKLSRVWRAVNWPGPVKQTSINAPAKFAR